MIGAAMEIEGRSAEELCQEAFEFLQQGRLAAAVERLEKVLAARPDYFDAHHYLGIAYGYMGRLDEAEEHLRKAAELLPDNAPARYNLGLVLHYRGKHEEAMREFRASLESNPYYEPVRKILAELGEPVEQMVEEILEAQAAAEEERKTFAEKFAEAPWAALKEREAELIAPPPVEEEKKPPERPLSNLSARVVTSVLDAIISAILGVALSFTLSAAGVLPMRCPFVAALGEKGPSVSGGQRPLGPMPPGAKGLSPEEVRKALKKRPEGRPSEGVERRTPTWEEVKKEVAEAMEKVPMTQRLLSHLPGLAFSFLYYGLMWAILAKTLGMMILGLELTDTNYAKPAPWRGIVRWIVFNLTSLAAAGILIGKPSLVTKPFLFLLILALGLLMLLANLVLIAATPKKQAIHDLAAGTLVVGRSLPVWVGILVVVVLIGLIVGLPFVFGLALFAALKRP